MTFSASIMCMFRYWNTIDAGDMLRNVLLNCKKKGADAFGTTAHWRKKLSITSLLHSIAKLKKTGCAHIASRSKEQKFALSTLPAKQTSQVMRLKDQLKPE
jgi:hypothetical protein